MPSRRAALLLLPALLAGCPEGQPGAADGGVPSAAELLRDRPYPLTVPAAYDGGAALPLVLVLHGHGSSGAQVDAYFGMSELAATRPFFVARPNGTANGDGVSFWNYAPNPGPPYDVAYLSAVIDDVKAKYRIAPGQVFVVGHSEGAHMAHRLGCDAADHVAALAAHAGQLSPRPGACAPSQPVSALVIHGDADEVLPYEGGPLMGDPPVHAPPSAHDTAAAWARADGCSGALAATGQTLDLLADVDGGETTVEAYSGCAGMVAVELWTNRGGTHGPDLQQPAWPNALMDFLLAHGR